MAETNLAKMKRQCRVLADVFTDPDLQGFLDDRTTLVDSVSTVNVRGAIYDALTSAATTEWNSMGRGSVSMTRVDFMRLRRQFATAGTITAVRTVEELADDEISEE